MPVVKEQLLSQTVYDTDGVTTQWEFNFSGGYVSTDHVKAYVLRDGARTDVTVTAGMLIGQYLLQITPAIAAGGELTIYRDTPRTQPLVNFQDRGAINEASLDTNAKQAVFVSAEVADFVSRTDLAGATEAAEDAALAAAAAASAAAIAGPAATAAAASATAAAASAATVNPANFATAAQGAKADTAVQPADLTAGNITDASATGRSVLTAVSQTAARTAIGAQAAGSYAASGANSDITALTGLTSPIPRVNTISKIESLPNPTLSANAMTLPASAHALDFRSATLSNGLPSTVTGTAAALVIPAGATLGTTSGVQGTLVEVIINNAGTLEKAVVNVAGGNDLSESGVISTTAISASSTAANVFYSTTARTNVPYRVVRTITSTQATAGQWATSPSLVQGHGGNALSSMSSIGYGQTWQNVGGSRALGITYYNTTGKPIGLRLVQAVNAGADDYYSISINGGPALPLMNNILVTGVVGGSGFTVIPAGASYVITATAGFARTWLELR